MKSLQETVLKLNENNEKLKGQIRALKSTGKVVQHIESDDDDAKDDLNGIYFILQANFSCWLWTKYFRSLQRHESIKIARCNWFIGKGSDRALAYLSRRKLVLFRDLQLRGKNPMVHQWKMDAQMMKNSSCCWKKRSKADIFYSDQKEWIFKVTPIKILSMRF